MENENVNIPNIHPEFKTLVIETLDKNINPAYILPNEYTNVYMDREITYEEIEDAIDLMITYFMQQNIYKISVNLIERDKEKISDVKIEVTMDEIREKFGNNIRIVDRKE